MRVYRTDTVAILIIRSRLLFSFSAAEVKLAKVEVAITLERLLALGGRSLRGGGSAPIRVDDDIIHRLMLPMCLETIRCLEDGIVASAAEADLGLIYGLGFPPFRGGALKYVDDLGAAAFVALCDRYQELGKLYEPTQKLRDMAANNQTFYTQ